MNVSLGVRLASLILLIGSTSACLNPFPPLQRPRIERGQSQPVSQIPAQPKWEHKKSVQNPVPVNFDVSTETGKVMNDAFNALAKEDFQWLEQEAGKARREKERLFGGYWKIANMYFGLSGPSIAADEEWKKHFERLNRWKEKFPESITARVALAESWIDYAWQARGGGFAYTVTDEGRRLFNERINFAEKELFEAKSLEQRCPHWFASLMVVGRTQGWDLEDFDGVYQEAVKFEPHYYYYALEKATYLFPRWHGSIGDWEAFVEQAANEAGGTQGEILYYLVVSDYLRDYSDAPYDRSKLSMPRVNQGFYTLKKTYGADNQRLNEFAKFACRINDYLTAHEAFEEIGGNWLEGTWRSKESFDRYKSMAALSRKFYDRQNRR
ncbi:MAG TPA: hypothetical protein VF604_13090 [Pyrinomonadaceae bacterium]|jgi:hypothetical protein